VKESPHADRLTIRLEPELRRDAEEVAARWRVSLGHVIRESLRDFLSRNRLKESIQDLHDEAAD
jgi:predicted transcriptional regulator